MLAVETEQQQAALVKRAMNLLENVRLTGYRFEVTEGHGGVYLRANYYEHDVYTSQYDVQHTRKWLLSPHMTDSEIIQTAFKCASTSYEHRVREHFLYRGRRIFGPHFDVNDLWELCEDRENAGGRQPQGAASGTKNL